MGCWEFSVPYTVDLNSYYARRREARERNPSESERGFTVIELLLVFGIIGVIVALAIPTLDEGLEVARIARAIGDIKSVEKDILTFEVFNNRLPNSLDELEKKAPPDPWGNPYQYLNFANGNGNGGGNGVPGAARKDQNLVPINSSFDLFSMGRDGASVPPLTANPSQDDVVRGNDGSFVGLARNY